MFCCTLFYVHSSFAIILMEKIELVALLSLSSWCLVMVEHRVCTQNDRSYIAKSDITECLEFLKH